MKIHEYQAKELFKQVGITVPHAIVALSKDEAHAAFDLLADGVKVVKAQIHAGGRGKGGGVKVCKNKDEFDQAVSDIWQMNLVTHQTGNQGQVVRRLLLEEGCAIDRELYCAMVIDRQVNQVVLIMSKQGGMEIEKVAEEDPDAILKVWIDPQRKIEVAKIDQLAAKLDLAGEAKDDLHDVVSKLYQLFLQTDASLVEINPLVLTQANRLVALDGKMNFDSNGLFRQQQIAQMRDLEEEDPLELAASEFDLSYISLDGNIGCMVNGAGLAMATMDAILLYGGSPANFLDVGGGASKDQVKAAFALMMKNEKIKAILINIFGGIMRCDVIAEGVVVATSELDLNIPLVVRLEGTNVEQGREILAKSGLDIITATDMTDAAKSVVAASK